MVSQASDAARVALGSDRGESSDVDRRAHIIGMRNLENGEFIGELADPIPERWDGERLVRL
ncbi:hypothetical protein GCM10029992_66320 [Glycomyces albus]